MCFIVYADESYRKTDEYSGQLIVGGFIGSADCWAKFSAGWQEILNKYKAPYFHFRELHAHERENENNPYFAWSNDKVDDFIHDLAMIAGHELLMSA